MNDKDLREALINLHRRFGTPTAFIAHSVGVSREHLSRWLHDESYVISNQLKLRLKDFTERIV